MLDISIKDMNKEDVGAEPKLHENLQSEEETYQDILRDWLISNGLYKYFDSLKKIRKDEILSIDKDIYHNKRYIHEKVDLIDELKDKP